MSSYNFHPQPDSRGMPESSGQSQSRQPEMQMSMNDSTRDLSPLTQISTAMKAQAGKQN